MPSTPYVETRTEVTTEQPDLRSAVEFIANQPEDQLVAGHLKPTVNDPGKWTVVVHLRAVLRERAGQEG